MSSNITWHSHQIKREDREKVNGHKSFVLWFTGLSGSGKSTLASELEVKLYERGCRTYILDADNVRHGLCRDLEFSEEDRVENLRRVAELSKTLVDAGIIVLATFISPLESMRNQVKEIVGEEDFHLIYVDTSLEECERRDPKGLYKKARRGEIKNFTGIDQPFEAPKKCLLKTSSCGGSVDGLLGVLEKKKLV